jgi:hypothetical protein
MGPSTPSQALIFASLLGVQNKCTQLRLFDPRERSDRTDQLGGLPQAPRVLPRAPQVLPTSGNYRNPNGKTNGKI